MKEKPQMNINDNVVAGRRRGNLTDGEQMRLLHFVRKDNRVASMRINNNNLLNPCNPWLQNLIKSKY